MSGTDGKIRWFKRRKPSEDGPYDPRGMNTSLMPFGCWIWIMLGILVLVSIAGLLKKMR